jgi:hypothetical protein
MTITVKKIDTEASVAFSYKIARNVVKVLFI